MLQGVVHQDAGGTIIAMNPAAERILGKTREQLLGSSSVREEHQPIREDGSPFPGLEHPAMVALQTGQTVRGVVVGVFNPQVGAYRWIRIDAVPVFRPRETRPAEVYTVFEDITEHRQAEEELLSSEAFLNTLLEQSPHTMWISNAHGTLVRTNQAMRDMFQVTDEEVVGKYNLLQDEIVQDQGLNPHVRVVFEKGKSAQFWIAYDTSRLKHLKLVNPRYLYLDVTISPIFGATGEVTNAVIQHLDITERKQAELKLREWNASLEQRVAERTLELQGVVHQIAQPLSAIGANLFGLIKLKARDLQRCDALATVKDVEADVIRMREIVRHLRKLVGQGPRTSALTKLNSIVTEVLPLLRQRADSRMCRIAVELGDDEAAVHVDSVQLTQVIFNLVSNALDASENCPPERREILVTTRPHCEKTVEPCVSDAGNGIAPETFNRLFTPFFSTKPDGLGVGLRLSQTMVQAHGGRIEGYNSPDGVGATFRVVLPAH